MGAEAGVSFVAEVAVVPNPVSSKRLRRKLSKSIQESPKSSTSDPSAKSTELANTLTERKRNLT